jgi:hypothetical protein
MPHHQSVHNKKEEEERREREKRNTQRREKAGRKRYNVRFCRLFDAYQK